MEDSMKPSITVLVLALTCLAIPRPADAQMPPPSYSSEPPPSSGVGLIVTGSIFVGVGAINLITAPICKTDLVQDSVQNVCLGASLVIGGTFLAIGIPLLAVGVHKRNKFREWKQEHRLGALEGLGFAAASHGGALTWEAHF